MPAWVLSGHRKLNLDKAAWIDRSPDGAVHVVFDGALNHTFHGPAADAVWKMIPAREADPAVAKAGTAGATKSRRTARKA